MREVKNKSKRIEAEFLLNYGRSNRKKKKILKLLRLVGEGRTTKDVSKRLRFSKQRVFYWIQKAKRDGLIRQIGQGRPAIYELTAFGQKFLTGSERGFQEPCTLEDYAMKFRVIADRSSIKWGKLGDPKNWVKLGVKIGSVTVVKTTQHVIIHAGQLSGFYYEDLFMQAGAIIQMVRAKLLDLGVETAEVGIPIRDPNVKMFTPEAEYLHEKYGNIRTEDGTIDASPPEKLPHEERNRKQQRSYLAIPDRLRRIEQTLAVISDTQEALLSVQEKQSVVLENFAKFLSGLSGQQEVNGLKKQTQEQDRLYF
jgi:hypothetical protein